MLNNQKISSEKKILKRLLSLLNATDRKYIFLLILFSFFVSAIETIGVTAIMPFIAVASDFSLIDSNQYYSMVFKIFAFESNIHFIISFGLLLIFFYLFRGLVNLIYYHLLSRFSQTRYHLIGYRLFGHYMDLTYKEFTGRNSSIELGSST